jgi:hypothetical protein
MKGSLFPRSTAMVSGLMMMLAPLWMAHGQHLDSKPSLPGATGAQVHPQTSAVLLEPREKPAARPSWLMSSVQVGKVAVPAPSLVLVGAGAVAGGVGSFFGLQSRSRYQSARDSIVQDQRGILHGEAVRSAQKANVLFGTATVLALSAVVTAWIAKSDESSHVGVSR